MLPAVQLAASYLLADADDAAGGDWFDAVPAGGGRVALVVGDVVGHGVAASAAMGQLRTVLQDRLDEKGDILAAVTAADRMAGRIPGARSATVCVVLLDPADGSVAYCSAGHPPPLVTSPNGSRFLTASGQGPLGTGADYMVLHDKLSPDQTILLYSDGIIERPGRSPAVAAEELARAASDAVARRGFDETLAQPAVDRACTQTLEVLVRHTGHADDITLLAAQRQHPAPPLQLELPAVPAAVTVARTAIEGWVDTQRADEPSRVALSHAVTELVTNACEHARPDDADATVTVMAGLSDDGQAELTVTDNGRWAEPARPGDENYREGRGFGLAMTASLVDSLDIDRADTGTAVTVRRRLTRSARLLTADEVTRGIPSPEPMDRPELMLILDQPAAPSSRIAVHGPLDASNVEELGTELDRLTQGGTRELIVDLTAVTHLASAAVAELYRSNRGTTSQQQYPLRLYAPDGSTAQQILALVGLPHTITDPHVAAAAPDGTTSS